MTKNITDEELDALLHDYAHTLGHSPVDVTDAVMHRVGKMPFLLPSYNLVHRRRRMAVAAVAALLLLSTTGAGLGHYQLRVADERLASMFSSVYDYDFSQESSVYMNESTIGQLMI